MILQEIRARAWQIGAFASVAAVAALGVTLAVSKIDNTRLVRLNDRLDLRINDPKVGLLAQLTQVRTNEETLKVALDQQNTALKKVSADSARTIAELTAQLKIAQAERARVEKQVTAFLSVKPRGNTLEERVLDIDNRMLEMLE